MKVAKNIFRSSQLKIEELALWEPWTEKLKGETCIARRYAIMWQSRMKSRMNKIIATRRRLWMAAWWGLIQPRTEDSTTGGR
jgi:hypothetical protein